MNNTLSNQEVNRFTKETPVSRFDILAKQWDSKPMRVESAMKFVDHVKTSINKDISNFKVLDYGCGSGLVSFGFASDVKSIDGYDNSFGMIETYNEKSKSLNLEHISGYLHDINIESIKNNSYDLVVTNMTMHHIKDINNFIISLKNSLNIDGHLYIADLVKEDGSFHSSGNEGVEHFGFDEDTLYKAFKLAGLIDIKYEIIQTIQKPNRTYPIFSISGKVS